MSQLVKFVNDKGLYLNVQFKGIVTCESSSFYNRLQGNGLMEIEPPSTHLKDFLALIEGVEKITSVKTPAFSEKTMAFMDALEQFLVQQKGKKIMMPHCIGGWSNLAKNGNAYSLEELEDVNAFIAFAQKNMEGIKAYSTEMKQKKKIWLEVINEQCPKQKPGEEIYSAHNNNVTWRALESLNSDLLVLYKMIHYFNDTYGISNAKASVLDPFLDTEQYNPNGGTGKKAGDFWQMLSSLEHGVGGIKKLLEAKKESTTENIEKPTEAYALWLAESGGFMDKNKNAGEIANARLFPSVSAIERTAKSASYGNKKESAWIVKVSIEGLENSAERYKHKSSVFAQWAAKAEKEMLLSILNGAEEPLKSERIAPLEKENFGLANSSKGFIIASPKEDDQGVEKGIILYGYKNEWVTELGSALPQKKLSASDQNYLMDDTYYMVLELNFAPVQIVKSVGIECRNAQFEQLQRSCAFHQQRLKNLMQEKLAVTQKEESLSATPSMKRKRL